MRRCLKIALAVGLAAFLFREQLHEAWQHGRDALEALAARTPGPAWRLKKVDSAVTSMVYRLEADRWLVFDLPEGQTVLKVLTNADLPLARRAELGFPLADELRWPYALVYQLVDAQGRTLIEREYHQRTRLSEFHDAELGETITAAFYLGENDIPADTRTMLIGLGDAGAPVAQVRLRLAHVAEPLTGVFVRVYDQQFVTEQWLRHVWKRMPPPRRQQLARGNVYPEELLSAEERDNLLGQRWLPAAPRGVTGRDYQQRLIHVLRETDAEPIRPPALPAGLRVDERHRGIISLPEEGGWVRINFEPVQGGPLPIPMASIPELSIIVRWRGRELQMRQSYTVAWNGAAALWEGHLLGGLIEIEAPAPMAVRVFLASAHDQPKPAPSAAYTEITPTPTPVWAYDLRGDGAVEFPVLHDGTSATPFRIDLRRIGPETIATAPAMSGSGTSPPPESIAYEMLDAHGGIVQQGRMQVDQPVSVYDWLTIAAKECAVSDPATHYFAVPPGVTRLRFAQTTNPMLVTAYNRPGRLTKVTRVPEDYFSFNRDDAEQRSWFLLRPFEHDALVRQGRMPVLIVQSRPTADDPDLRAGRYQWTDHLPQGSWRARHLLTTRPDEAVFRPEALAVTFREIIEGKETAILFQAPAGVRQIEPTLAYLREETEPFHAQVHIDGRLHHEVRLDGARGVVQMPPLPVNEAARRVKVSASRPMRLFLNHHDPGGAPALLKRLAIHMESAELRFEVDKTALEQENLALTWYGPLGDDRTVLRVRLEAPEAVPGPHAAWTFRERVFDVRPAIGPAVPVLETPGASVAAGQVCLFPLGADLKTGRYQLSVQVLDGPGGYLVLSRTTPGAYERRDYHLEPAAAAVPGPEKTFVTQER